MSDRDETRYTAKQADALCRELREFEAGASRSIIIIRRRNRVKDRYRVDYGVYEAWGLRLAVPTAKAVPGLRVLLDELRKAEAGS